MMIAKPPYGDGIPFHSDDIIVQITATAVCGPEIYIFDGYVPQVSYGDAGHEYIGKIVHSDPEIDFFSRGDRIAIPMGISSLPEYSSFFSREPEEAETHVRINRIDHGLAYISPDLSDDQILLLADVYPAARMTIDDVRINRGDTVAVWGCGISGQIAIQYAKIMGAGCIIAIDDDPDKLGAIPIESGAETVNSGNESPFTAIRQFSGGKGVHCFIDTIGIDGGNDAPPLHQAIDIMRPGGRISIPQSYRKHINEIPFGTALSRKLSIKIGRAVTLKSLSAVLEQIEDGYLNPGFIHTVFPHEEVPSFYNLPTKKLMAAQESFWQN